MFIARAPSGLPGPPAIQRGRYGWRAIISGGGTQWPFALKRNIVDAAPLKSIAADADAVTHSDPIAHDEIEKAVVSVDDDRARRLFGAVVHGLAPQFGCQIAIPPGVIDTRIDIFDGRR